MLNLYFISLTCLLLPISILITNGLTTLASQYIRINQHIKNNHQTHDQKINLAKIYIQRKKWLQAIKILESSIKDKENIFLKHYSYIGSCYLYLKKYKLAEYYYKKALQKDSKNILAMSGLANLYYETKRRKDAKMIYKQILVINKEDKISNLKRN
nr:hypothetical protein [Gloiopeltis furcata]